MPAASRGQSSISCRLITPVCPIKVGTLNGATFLGRADRVGSIALGKQADLVVVSGDPSTRIGDVRNVQLVFKQGVGYDPAKLIESVRPSTGARTLTARD